MMDVQRRRHGGRFDIVVAFEQSRQANVKCSLEVLNSWYVRRPRETTVNRAQSVREVSIKYRSDDNKAIDLVSKTRMASRAWVWVGGYEVSPCCGGGKTSVYRNVGLIPCNQNSNEKTWHNIKVDTMIQRRT